MSAHADRVALEREPDADARRAAAEPAAVAPPPAPAPAPPSPPAGAADASLSSLPPRLRSSTGGAARRVTAVLPPGAWQSAQAVRTVVQEPRVQVDDQVLAGGESVADETQPPQAAQDPSPTPEPRLAALPAAVKSEAIVPPTMAPSTPSPGFDQGDGAGERSGSQAGQVQGASIADAAFDVVQAVNDRIARLPAVRDLAALSQAVQQHLRMALRIGVGTHLVLLGQGDVDTLEDAPAGTAQLLAALQAKARVRGRKRLLLQRSPHHGAPASRALLLDALRCGFGARGHDVLGQMDPAEASWRLDDRERAMAGVLEDALRESDLVVVTCRTRHVPALCSTPPGAPTSAVVALMSRVERGDAFGARRMRALLDRRGTLCLRVGEA